MKYRPLGGFIEGNNIMTPILKVITEYCSLYIDDVRLSDLAVTDMPLFARRMWQYFKPAISLFNLPTEMPEYLVGTEANPKLIEPTFDSTLYTTTADYTNELEINLGEEYKGYELCACRVRTIDKAGNVILTPIPVEYNSETGIVSFSATPENPILKGTIFDFDFYTDGYFVETLSNDIMNILGMCFENIWLIRFKNDWLSIVTKVEDKSFFEQNRANKMNADRQTLIEARERLSGQMRRYEQNLYKKKVNDNIVSKI